MKRLKLLLKFVAATLGVALAIATVFLVPTIWGKPWSYEHFTLRVLVGEFMHSPQLRGRLGVGVPFTSQSALDDLSPAAHQATMKRYDDAIAMQERYARPEGEVDALSYDVFGVFLRDTRAANGISPYTITHLLGPHVQVPEFLIQYHAVEDAESAESYLQRLSNVPGALQGAVEFARYRAESGYVAPTFILDRIVADATAFAEPTAADNPLVTEFAQKLTTSGVEDAPAYVAQAERIVEAEVYPAFADYARDMAELRSQSTDEPGLRKFPGGSELYRAHLHYHTTTDLSPDELHAIGTKTLADLEAQAQPLLDELGLEYASVGEGLRMIADSPRNTFPDSPEGREEVLSTARRLIERVDALSSPHFGVRPSVGVEVERVPEFQEESSPFATYKPPAMDGSRPGLFVVNLRDVSKVSRGSLPTLVCHEAVPGHHFQLAIAQNLDGLPFFRKLVPFTAFTEGWALYAETLCDEMGFFDSPLARLGYLDAQMVRATRLIVDTGLHDREWTREQAITFMAEHTGLPLSDIEVEVNRYTMLPGQACGYMVGQQRILEIRGRAEDALGERFDAKAFHDRLLTFGSLPLDLLEREMDAWVDAEMRAQRP